MKSWKKYILSIQHKLTFFFLSIPSSLDHAIEWIMEVVWLMTWKSMDNMILAWGANIRNETCSLDSPWSNEKRFLYGFFWLVSSLVLLLIRSIPFKAEDFSFIQLKLYTNMFPCYWTGCKSFSVFVFCLGWDVQKLHAHVNQNELFKRASYSLHFLAVTTA